MAVPYVFTPALVMLSHNFINKDKVVIGFFIAMVAAFSSYSSPPYFLGLSTLFLFKRSFKKFVIFILPAFFYVIFYFSISYFFPDIQIRINNEINLLTLIKNLFIQLFSLLDVLIGPSFWIKILYGLISNSFLSLIIGLLIFIIIYKHVNKIKLKVNYQLILSFLIILIASSFMFALTGKYPQIIFNLGNRVTIYGSLFFVLLLIYLPNKFFYIIFLIIILSVTGISNHWKNWNINQKLVLSNIENNKDFNEITDRDTLFILGNNYSQIGKISHIEFFKLPWITKPIFNKNDNIKNVIALNKSIKITNKIIFDKKNNTNYFLFNDHSDVYNIYLYNSYNNKLKIVDINEIIKIHSNIQTDKRHWLQLYNIDFIKSLVLKINPRLNSIFK